AGRGRRDRLRAEPHARRGRRAMAGGAGGGRDLHGLRDRRMPWVRGAAQTRRIRPRVQGRPGLSRRGHRLGRAAVASPLRGGRMSTDMSVAVGGMNLRSPVLAASGTFGYGTEVPLLERRALGAVVSKGIFLRAREGTPPPRIAETPSGMLNAIGLQGPGAEVLIRDYAPRWAEWDFPVLVNINGESAADALCAITAFVGMSIDLNAYQPRLSFRTGGLSGPAIRPLAIHLAHQAARAVRIPVIGIGGISRAEDALEFLVAGCTAVQVGT